MSETPSDYYGKPPDRSIQADPNDVATIPAIIAASYECISGPAGQPRDWNRMRTLILPEAHQIRTGRLADGSFAYKVMSSDDYQSQMNDWLVHNGFFEKEIHLTIERFGNIAHAFSTYESTRNEEDSEPFMRGINSFQLFYDGQRWWIVNILWQHESPEFPIPRQYLP